MRAFLLPGQGSFLSANLRSRSNSLNPGKIGTLMSLRFEFDRANKILLLRAEGRTTDEMLAKLYGEVGKYWATTDTRACIVDFSSVTEQRASSEFIRREARRQPHMADRPVFIVVDSPASYGLARMFQIVTEGKRPQLHIERTLGAALAVLGVQSSQIVDEEWQKPQQIEQSYCFPAEITNANLIMKAEMCIAGDYFPSCPPRAYQTGWASIG